MVLTDWPPSGLLEDFHRALSEVWGEMQEFGSHRHLSQHDLQNELERQEEYFETHQTGRTLDAYGHLLSNWCKEAGACGNGLGAVLREHIARRFPIVVRQPPYALSQLRPFVERPGFRFRTAERIARVLAQLAEYQPEAIDIQVVDETAVSEYGAEEPAAAAAPDSAMVRLNSSKDLPDLSTQSGRQAIKDEFHKECRINGYESGSVANADELIW